MSNRSLDQLVQIVRNGGSLDFHVGTRSTEDLVHLVRNMTANATVILRGVGTRPTDDLVHIARNGAGTVILDLE